MSNPRNNGTLVGRLAGDPVVFTNKDGSKSVKMTIFADRNYTNAAGERKADPVPVEAFVRASTQGLGPFDNVHKGDLVGVNFGLRMEPYPKNGQMVYELKAVVEDITFLEPRNVTQARLAERAKAANETNKAAAQATPAPAAQPQPMPATASAVGGEQLPFSD